jgi:hypothetical protein
MVELVAIPKDLFERMADAVQDLHAALEVNEDDAGADKAEALYDEVEENWPEQTFPADQLQHVPGRKWHRQKKLSGTE